MLAWHVSCVVVVLFKQCRLYATVQLHPLPANNNNGNKKTRLICTITLYSGIEKRLGHEKKLNIIQVNKVN